MKFAMQISTLLKIFGFPLISKGIFAWMKENGISHPATES